MNLFAALTSRPRTPYSISPYCLSALILTSEYRIPMSQQTLFIEDKFMMDPLSLMDYPGTTVILLLLLLPPSHTCTHSHARNNLPLPLIQDPHSILPLLTLHRSLTYPLSHIFSNKSHPCGSSFTSLMLLILLLLAVLFTEAKGQSEIYVRVDGPLPSDSKK